MLHMYRFLYKFVTYVQILVLICYTCTDSCTNMLHMYRFLYTYVTYVQIFVQKYFSSVHVPVHYDWCM